MSLANVLFCTFCVIYPKNGLKETTSLYFLSPFYVSPCADALKLCYTNTLCYIAYLGVLVL
jgi:hypothetical protein